MADILEFPSDLVNPPLLLMSAYTFTTSVKNSGSDEQKNLEVSNKGNLDVSIALPFPSELGITDDHMIDTTDAFAGGVEQILTAGLTEAARNFTGKLYGAVFSETFLNEIQRAKYNGINLRTFTYNWTLIPSSEAEHKTLDEIVYKFRELSLPVYGGANNAPKLPAMWELEPWDGKNNLLFNPSFCLIKSFNVTYGDQGKVYTFKGSGKPVVTNISITFQEIYQSGAESLNNVGRSNRLSRTPTTVRGL